jgi:hypothetical protein
MGADFTLLKAARHFGSFSAVCLKVLVKILGWMRAQS